MVSTASVINLIKILKNSVAIFSKPVSMEIQFFYLTRQFMWMKCIKCLLLFLGCLFDALVRMQSVAELGLIGWQIKRVDLRLSVLEWCVGLLCLLHSFGGRGGFLWVVSSKNLFMKERLNNNLNYEQRVCDLLNVIQYFSKNSKITELQGLKVLWFATVVKIFLLNSKFWLKTWKLNTVCSKYGI